MYEQEFRKRTNLHSSRKRDDTPKKPGRFGFTGFQITVCLLCIVSAVIIRFTGGTIYTLVRENVSKAFDTVITSSQINQVFATIKSGLPNVSEVFGSPSASGSKSSSKASSSSKSSASSKSSTSSKSSSSKSSSSSSSAASSSSART